MQSEKWEKKMAWKGTKCSELLRTSLEAESTPSVWKSDGNLHHQRSRDLWCGSEACLEGERYCWWLGPVWWHTLYKAQARWQGLEGQSSCRQRSSDTLTWAPCRCLLGEQLCVSRTTAGTATHLAKWPLTHWGDLLELPFAGKNLSCYFLHADSSVPQPQNTTMANPACP